VGAVLLPVHWSRFGLRARRCACVRRLGDARRGLHPCPPAAGKECDRPLVARGRRLRRLGWKVRRNRLTGRITRSSGKPLRWMPGRPRQALVGTWTTRTTRIHRPTADMRRRRVDRATTHMRRLSRTPARIDRRPAGASVARIHRTAGRQRLAGRITRCPAAAGPSITRIDRAGLNRSYPRQEWCSHRMAPLCCQT
jgi:hypothetical protein